jgi:hypothetical protein
MTPEKPTLDALVQEAKLDASPDIDWGKVEAKLFPRVEREARAEAALAAYAGAKRAWAAAAVVIAVAAAVPLLFPRAGAAPLGEASAARPAGAGVLLEKDGPAIVHATAARAPGGATARDLGVGGAIAQGDVIDTRAGRAVFKRTEPSSVAWSLEDGSQVEVRAARGTLVLALAKGAVEAQVAPVAEGEAFAIDVEGSRVAVHGTHLRVERQGNRAVVDLREGVVSIGAPPKSGSTYGDLVTAPAHVEFDSTDPHGTLKVSHELGRVRAPQLLEPSHAQPPSTLRMPSLPTPVAAIPTPAPAPLGNTPPRPAVVAAPAPAPSPPLPVAVPVPAAPAAVSSPVPPPPAPARVDPNPEGTIADQVRACARKHVEHADGVVITVSTRLELRIGDTGMVTAAVFDPPLRAEVQACAASAIYGTRFSQPGAVSIGIDVTP